MYLHAIAEHISCFDKVHLLSSRPMLVSGGCVPGTLRIYLHLG